MDDPLDFSASHVLVIGGSSGIGNAISRAFRDRGARVCLTGTRPAATDYRGEDSEFDGMDYRQLDVSIAGSVESLGLPYAGLSVLVNSQGVANQEDPTDIAAFQRTLDINLGSVMRSCQRFRSELTAAGGSVINIGSGACFTAVPHRPGYSASKGGLLTLTRSLASAWAASGVRVNGIAPGYIPTRMNLDQRQDEQAYRARLARIPMQRWGDAGEVAQVALFLASPMASYITGQMLAVDGGLTL